MSHPMQWIDIAGYWIGIFITLSILTFLYKDNPFYKLAEHLFVGTSIGYIVMQQYYDVVRPNMIDRLSQGHWWFVVWIPTAWWYLFPLLLVLMLLSKLGPPRWGWIGRYPLAFVVAFYAGLQINAVAQSDLGEQMKASMQPIKDEKVDVNHAPAEDLSHLPGMSPPVARKIVAARDRGTRFQSLDDLAKVPELTPEQRADLEQARGHVSGLDAQATTTPGGYNWFGIASKFLLLVGLLASLIYFYFSIEQRGPIGKVSRFGVWVLMIGFGASFGYTVQGRLSLAVGRAMDVLDKDKPASIANQIHGPIVAIVCIFLIIAGLAVWEVRGRRGGGGPPAPAPHDESTVPDEDLPQY